MRRSTQVAAPLLAAAALAITTGCRKPEMQRCVDESNHVVADSFCASQADQPQQRPDGHGGFIPFIFPYRYYYGGWGGFGLGSAAGGGSFARDPARSYINSSGRTLRGGFGRSFSEGGSHFSGHAGGAGE
jgi:hypothetical protein